MCSRRTALVLIAMLSVPAPLAQASGQPQPQAKPEAVSGPTISLASPIAAPGERTVVAVRIDGGGTPVHRAQLEIEFPEGALTFVEARPAFRQELSVKATLVPAADPKSNARLSVTAASDSPIAPGDAVELVFEVSRTVYTDRDAPLVARAGSLQGAKGDAIDRVKLEDGKVQVSVASVVFGCFFYMH